MDIEKFVERVKDEFKKVSIKISELTDRVSKLEAAVSELQTKGVQKEDDKDWL